MLHHVVTVYGEHYELPVEERTLIDCIKNKAIVLYTDEDTTFLPGTTSFNKLVKIIRMRIKQGYSIERELETGKIKAIKGNLKLTICNVNRYGRGVH